MISFRRMDRGGLFPSQPSCEEVGAARPNRRRTNNFIGPVENRFSSSSSSQHQQNYLFNDRKIKSSKIKFLAPYFMFSTDACDPKCLLWATSTLPSIYRQSLASWEEVRLTDVCSTTLWFWVHDQRNQTFNKQGARGAASRKALWQSPLTCWI